MSHPVTGIITEIQRYSVHDGPGLRTVVFLKGCPLRCAWCQNPETQKTPPEVAYDSTRCTGCATCVTVCPTGALQQKEDGTVWRNRLLCTACAKCVDACPSGAQIQYGQEVSCAAILQQVMRDRPFYQQSGGGVTLSGGEPSWQPALSGMLLSTLQKHGIHTAMETCGYQQWELFRELLVHTDLVLFDIKHPDPTLHRHYTGVSNETILCNLEKTASLGKRIVLRVPLIANFNDDKTTLFSLVKLAKLSKAASVHLLPFHQMGEHKWETLEKPYSFQNRKATSQETAEKAAAILTEHGIAVNIGGHGIY